MADLPPPQLFGRALRILAGLACFVGAFLVIDLPADVGELVGAAALALLGLSFVVGGLLANPGCELTALPNLVLEKKRHFF